MDPSVAMPVLQNNESEDDDDAMEENNEVVVEAAVVHAAQDTDEEEDDDDDDAVESVAVEDDDFEDDEEDVAEVQAVEDGGEEEEDVVLAAVVVDDPNGGANDEDDESISVAEPVEVVIATEPAKKKRKKPASSTARKSPVPSKKKAPTTAGGGSAKKKGGGGGGNKKKTPPKPPPTEVAGVTPQRMQAANDARTTLLNSVSSLPANLGDAQVRAFGKLQASSNPDNPFVDSEALYSVGFSCDRFDFSPAHGRTLKLRCSILDGRRIIAERKKLGRTAPEEEPSISEGPVFRIMWGRGVDEDEMDSYRFDATLHSDYDLTNSRGIPVAKDCPTMTPVEDMRVKTRFDDNEYFMGTIVTVSAKKKEKTPITIRYDDGTRENTEYPDPDIELFLPGSDPDIDPADGRVELTRLNQKPVSAVIGSSPLQAWSRALIKMGMIDEIMSDSGMEALHEKHLGNGSIAEQRARNRSAGSATTSSPALPMNGEPPVTASAQDGAVWRDPPSEKEKYLRREIAGLMEELKEATEEDRQAQRVLAETRISDGGPFLGNPFNPGEAPKAQQMSWLNFAIKRERNRITNKRKVITSVDILDKADTIYNQEISALIEGLPGSEHCASYMFRAHRGKAGQKAAAQNRAMAQEARKKQEQQEAPAKKKAPPKPAPKPGPVVAKPVAVKSREEEERLRKRKLREDEQSLRKRQKMEEEDQRKQVRINERMERLRMQVDDRLAKEVQVQRERVVQNMALKLSKEFARRRKAAEIVSAQTVFEEKRKSSSESDIMAHVEQPLPTLSKTYGEDIVRVYDFVSTFGEFFKERGYIQDIPSLDSLQSALDCIAGAPVAGMRRDDAISFLTDLAVALCKPLATTLTRILFASLIALNPQMQKDWGAAFFNDMSAGEVLKEEEKHKEDVILPVNSLTWQEIARLAFVADGLAELGLQRHEVAHIMRGYRSAGHPNSKEAQRLRKVEGHTIASLKQEIKEGMHAKIKPSAARTRMDIPCAPVLSQTDSHWFYLHVFVSQPETAVLGMRVNLEKAIELLKNSGSGLQALYDDLLVVNETLSQVQDMEHPSKSDIKTVKKARRQLVTAFDKHGGNQYSQKDRMTQDGKWPWQIPENSRQRLSRQQIGLLRSLSLTRDDYKKLTASRVEYMEDALRMKEDFKGKDNGENSDDEEDEENEGANDKPEEANEGGEGKGEATGDAKPDSTNIEGKEGENAKIGKETPYDEFCADVVEAPELIRRCLAVLRAIAVTNAAEPFLYPVDPQANPGYYDAVLRPMCLREAGRQLLLAGKTKAANNEMIEAAVAQFGRNMRLIRQNALSYTNAGPMVIAAGTEMLFVFERLFFDWVLAPEHLLPPLHSLDDEKCVDHHPTDDQSTVLLCDRCEGKYNIKRLEPPLSEIPRGDWYCPRCVTKRWYGTVDPRLQRQVLRSDGEIGTIVKCLFRFSEDPGEKPSLLYEVSFPGSTTEFWTLNDVDEALSSGASIVPPVRCLEAVAESPGYGDGIDTGMRLDQLVPVLLDPYTSDSAARSALASSVFRDTVIASATFLLMDPMDMNSSEWLRLFILLVGKVSACDVMQHAIMKMESKAAETMQPKVDALAKVTDIRSVFCGPAEPNESEILKEKSSKGNTSPGGTNKKPPGADGGVLVAATAKKAAPVVVDAGSVEVVEEVDVKSTLNNTTTNSATAAVASVPAVPSTTATEPGPEKDTYAEALEEKTKRQKVVEDLFAGQCIKNQVRTSVASFEQDTMSGPIDRVFSGEKIGLDFRNLQCRRTNCFFCGLPDYALGLPLMRIPNREEWRELIPFAVKNQRTHLIADDLRQTTDTSKPKLLVLRVRLDGELVSEDDPFLEEHSTDGGILELTPRADRAFQNELLFRYENDLPFVTGSLSAHECCAAAAHNSRKEQLLQEYRETQAEELEQDAGGAVGRTLQIGQDASGRSYWKLKADPEALFVCRMQDPTSIQWFRFPDAVAISAVMAALGKDPVVKKLKRLYPAAFSYVEDGSWSSKILSKQFPRALEMAASQNEDPEPVPVAAPNKMEVEGGYDPYIETEEVLIETKDKRLLWDGTVLALSRRAKKQPIDAYKVHYSGWSSRFVEWVHPSRVVEPSEHNRSLQRELLDEIAHSRNGLPSELNFLEAKDYVNAPDRARGSAPIPDFVKIAWTAETETTTERVFRLMKVALLAIEAALPVGSIQTTDSGVWRSSYAREWRQLVRFCQGPSDLMRLLIHLEDSISSEWLREDVGNIRYCMPNRWMAVGFTCAFGVAIRIILLDRAVKYNIYDRKRYAKRKRKS